MLAWYLCRSIDSAVVSETIYKCLEKGPIRQTRWHSAIASATKSHRYLPLGSGLNVSEHSEPFSVLLFSEIRLMLPHHLSIQSYLHSECTASTTCHYQVLAGREGVMPTKTSGRVARSWNVAHAVNTCH